MFGVVGKDVVLPGAKEKIAILRTALATPGASVQRASLGHARADACLNGGLQRSALHEIFAWASHESAGTAFAAAITVRLGGAILWIQQDYCALEYGALAPTGLRELGLDPSRLVLLRAPGATDALRAAADALTCAALGAVVIELAGDAKQLDRVAYRRLALAASQHGGTALLLRFGATPGVGGAETRWVIGGAPSASCGGWGYPVFDVELQRNRHGPAGRWLMQWSSDNGVFQSAHSGVVAPAFADRTPPPALAIASVA